MIQIGTLVGAPIMRNDSEDTYPSVDANEAKGGRYSLPSTTERDAITAECRRAGMECYCVADGNTYQLKNDLVTWLLVAGTDPTGGGGDVTLISGNFGEWTVLTGVNAAVANQAITPAFKSDLLAFPTRAITYITGQFTIDPSFAHTSILIGTISDANSFPSHKIIKFMIVEDIEMYLTVDVDGTVSLVSKDGFNLPNDAATTTPYFLDTFYQPLATVIAPTTYTYTRTELFTRGSCGDAFEGGNVSYSQDYTSTVDLATATALAMADPAYNAAGQAFADNPANGGTCTPVIGGNLTIENDAATQKIVTTSLHGTSSYLYGNVLAGDTFSAVIDNDTYNVTVKTGSGPGKKVTVNGSIQTSSSPGATFVFTGVVTPISITLEDN